MYTDRYGHTHTHSGKNYNTIVQSVLLYGVDSWTVSQRDLNKLKSFHHRAVRYITGQHIKYVESDGVWTHPDHETLLKKCRLLEFERYLESRRGTLRGYLETTHPTLLKVVKDLHPPARANNKILWWNQKCINKRELKQITEEWLSEVNNIAN